MNFKCILYIKISILKSEILNYKNINFFFYKSNKLKLKLIKIFKIIKIIKIKAQCFDQITYFNFLFEMSLFEVLF